MIKNKITVIFVPLLALVCTGCTFIMPWQTYDPNKTTKKEEESTGEEQMFLDTKFEKGFLAIPGGGTQINTGFIPKDRYSQNVSLKYGNNKNQPVWTLRQNNDVYNLNDKYCQNEQPDYDDGNYIFYDESKKLIVNPTVGSLYMELDSSIEYGPTERANSDTWAHMLIASSLSHQLEINNVSSLKLSMDIQMTTNIDKHIEKQYADEMILYLQLSTSNQDETALADKPLWFGIPLFNSDVSAFDKEYAQVDTAQGANSGGFIYKFAMSELFNSYESSLVDFNNHNINIELINYFETALNRAHNKGFWTSSTLKDLVISDMNFGFELPSKRKVGVQFSNLKLIAKTDE